MNLEGRQQLPCDLAANFYSQLDRIISQRYATAGTTGKKRLLCFVTEQVVRYDGTWKYFNR